ncbi:MAG: type IV secretion system DNA-binding domain-containing protein [Pyrinomonadaceae bacterium]
MPPQQDKSPQPISFFAEATFRNHLTPFGIKHADRRSHLYLIGKTGTGKSTLLERLIRQDIASGRGAALLDPHGDLVERVALSVPMARQADVIYFDPTDRTQSMGFNPLSDVPQSKRALAASGLVGVFRKLWSDSWGPRLEYILRNALLLLLDQPEATLADVLRLFDDAAYRKAALASCRNDQVRRFWTTEYEAYTPRFRSEVIAPVQNKVGAFLADPVLRRILTRPKSSFNLRGIMDEGKLLLVNLAKGKLGEDTTQLLGSLLVSSMGLAALRRADTPEEMRRDFYLYLDEFHTFTTLSLAGMLSELRKYRLNLIIAHQYLSQIDEQVRDAVLGNVGTIIAFRVGLTDAELLEGEFFPDFRATDLVNLPSHHIYVKLMIDGAVSRPFSARTLPPDAPF